MNLLAAINEAWSKIHPTSQQHLQAQMFTPPPGWAGEVWTPKGYAGVIHDYTPDEKRCYVRYFNTRIQQFQEKWFDTSVLNGRTNRVEE